MAMSSRSTLRSVAVGAMADSYNPWCAAMPRGFSECTARMLSTRPYVRSTTPRVHLAEGAVPGVVRE